MREAVGDLGGDPDKVNPLAPADLVIDHSVIADLFGRADAFERNVEIEYERNGERYQFLRWGQGAFNDFKVVPPGHRHRAPGQHRIPGQGGVGARRRRVSGHLRRHRLAHHDGERPRRAGLGRRRHRGRGGHAGPARVDAHPPRRRVQADRRAAGRRHRYRRRAHGHRDAAQARCGRQIRRVLRRRRRRGSVGQPRDAGQHEPRVRLHRSDFPDRRGDDRLPEDDRSQRRAAGVGGGIRQRARHVARPGARAEVLRVHRARPGRRRRVDRRAQASAGPHRADRRKDGFPQGHSQLRRGEPARRAHQARRGGRRIVPRQRPCGAVVRRQRHRRVRVGCRQAPRAGPASRSTVKSTEPRRLHPRPRRGGDRSDHVVHQHVQPRGDARAPPCLRRTPSRRV